jgi:hypothetical protein
MVPTGPLQADGYQPHALVPDFGRPSATGLFEGHTVAELADCYGFNYGSSSKLVRERDGKLKEFLEDWLLTAWANLRDGCGYTLETIELVKQELACYKQVFAHSQ